ncbi:MAG: hypothetical protein ACI32B_00170 [Erysipelotrichaceae bacterium]
MLPDKNELNDELIEQVEGGSSDIPELYGPASREAYGLPDILAVCLGHEDTYERTNEHSRNREPEPISKIAPVGDLKTTVPDLPKKDKLAKIH